MIDPSDEIRHAVAFIAAAFPSPAWGIETLRLYASELADLNGAILQAAVREWVRTRPDRPSIADLRTATANMTTRLRTQRRRRLRLAQTPPESLTDLEPADPAAVRQLLADVVRRLEAKRP